MAKENFLTITVLSDFYPRDMNIFAGGKKIALEAVDDTETNWEVIQNLDFMAEVKSRKTS